MANMTDNPFITTIYIWPEINPYKTSVINQNNLLDQTCLLNNFITIVKKQNTYVHKKDYG